MKKPKLLFADHGLFTSFAIKLSKWFEVFYFTPWSACAFPSPNNAFVGDGLEEITRVKDFWQIMPEIDIFFFADIYDGGLQEHLRSLGKSVFGAGRGDELEIFRWKMKKLMGMVDLPVSPCERVIGMSALRKYLKENEDVYVKVSAYRGICETFHSKEYKLIEPRLDEIENDLGGLKYVLPFIIESKIDAVIELGYDGYTIDGQYPNAALFGVEVKDCGYLGRIVKDKQIPKQVSIVNEKLAPLFKELTYRMFMSTEIRVDKEDTSFLIDMTCRLPALVSEVYQELYSNLDEIILAGAEGIVVEPKSIAKYGVTATIYSSFAEDHWAPIYIPDKVRQWVKLHNQTRIDNVDYIVPTNIRMGEMGAVVGIGDTLLEAIKHCRKNAEEISGFDINIKVESLVEGLEEIQKAQDFGITFCDEPLPTVEQIIGN